MKPESRRIITLTGLSIVLALVVLRIEIQNLSKTDWFIFDSLIEILSYSVGLLIAVPIILSSWKSFRASKKKAHLIPISILALSSLSIIALQFVGAENSSPIVLWAHYDGDTNGFTLKLREDNTYRLENYSILGGDFTEGNYRLENDTIYMDRKEPIGNDFMNDKLVITQDKVLFHLDKNGLYDTGFFSMRIIEKK